MNKVSFKAYNFVSPFIYLLGGGGILPQGM